MKLTITDGTDRRTVELHGEVIIGRERDCGLVLDDDKVSRHHARLAETSSGAIEVTDLGTTNGTWVAGSRITGPVVLQPGMSVRVGRHVVSLDGVASTAASTVIDLEPRATGQPPVAPIGYGAAAPITPFSPAGPPAPFGAPPFAPAAVKTKRRPVVPIIVGIAAVGVLAAAATVVLRRGDDGKLSTAQIVNRARSSVVLVTADVGGARKGSGTGFVVDARQGLIVTNNHVVNAGNAFTVGVGASKREAHVIAARPCDDLALLKVDDTSGLTQVTLGSQAKVNQGDQVVALGYPGTASVADNLVTNQGIVSVVKTRFDGEGADLPHYPNVLQHQAPINPGNSGGPLFDSAGRVVGVNSAGSSVRQNQNYAIGVDRLKEVLGEMRAGTSKGWSGFGLVFPTDERDFTDRDLPVARGTVIIDFVYPRTPPADPQVFQRVAPVLLAGVNGQRLDGSLDSYCKAVGSAGTGDKVSYTLVVSDSGDNVTVDLRLA